MSPTLANSILDIRSGETVGNSKCREWQQSTFPPSPTSGNDPSVPRELLSSPSQAPAASTSCICPFGALSSLFIGKNNLLLYMILELISLLLIRTSSSLSLALTCLYSLYSSAMGVRSSFCTFLVGVKADHEDFCNRKPPSTNKINKAAPLLHSWSGNKTKTLILWEKKAPTKIGVKKLPQQSVGCLCAEAEHNPTVPNIKSYLKHVLLLWNHQLCQTAGKHFRSHLSVSLWAWQNKIQPPVAWHHSTYTKRHAHKKKNGIWIDCSWLTGEF